MQRLIIGCGYLGSRIAAIWKNNGDSVFVTTRSNAKAETLRVQGYAPLVCNVMDRESLRQLPQVDSVVHAIGNDRSDQYSMHDVYVQGLTNILESLPPPKQFFQVSSTSVYGDDTDEIVNEDWSTNPNDGSGQTVLAAEKVVKEQLPSAMILRFAGIYGPGRLMLQQKIASGEPLVGDPEKWINLIHVDDGSQIIATAAQHYLAGEILNICDGHPVTRRDFYTELAQVIGAETPNFISPNPNDPPPRHSANRRISNEKMRQRLPINLKYPTYREGLRNSVT